MNCKLAIFFAVLGVVLSVSFRISIMWELENTQGTSTFPPVLTDDRVYSVHVAKQLVAASRATGDLVWSYQNTELLGGCAVAGDKVFAVTQSAVVSLNRGDGSISAQYALPDASGKPCEFGAPVVDGDIIFAGTSAGRVFALDSATLTEVWRTDLGAAHGVSSSVSLWGNFVIVGTFSGKVALLHRSDGKVSHEFTVSDVPAFDATEGVVSGIQTTIAVSNGVAFFSTSTPSKNFHALDLTTMKLAWSITPSAGFFAYTSPMIKDATLYIATSNGVLHCVDAANGQIHWSHETRDSLTARGQLTMFDNAVITVTNSGVLIGFDHVQMSQSFSLRLSGAGTIGSTPTLLGRQLVVAGAKTLSLLELAVIKGSINH